MDRVYHTGNKNGYSNPDYQLDELHLNSYNYQDDSKQTSTQTHMHDTSGKMFETQLDEEEDAPYASGEQSSVKRIGTHMLRLVLTITSIGLVLAIPMIVTASARYDDSIDDSIQNKNFVFWLFAWLETTWALASIAHVFALCFPYLFYVISKWVNPAHRRYWRVFRPLKKPFVFLITVALGWVFFVTFVEFNPSCSYAVYAAYQNVTNTQVAQLQAELDAEGNDEKVTAEGLGTDRTFFITATSVVDNILMNLIFWAVGFLFEKIVILYISVHYHYRSDHARIERTKVLINALTSLYEVSLTRHSLYSDAFQNQDIIIRDAVAAGRKNSRDTLKFFQKIGGASGKVLSAFGNMLGSGKSSHWLKPGSSYAIVEHALDRPASARALAQRIWLSFVPSGEKALTKEHITGAFTLDQKEAAEKCLNALDENENGDVRLTELEPMLVEAGKTRLNIYRNMQEIDHAINTLDWILLIWMTIFLFLIIMIGYIPFLKSLKDIFGFVGLGLGVAVNSLVGDFIRGSVYILFKHPYDIGDRIELYNMGEGGSVGVIVKRVSLLYCVFERTDNGALVQFPNSRLDMKRIENLSRSGQGVEALRLVVNINTSFKDLEYLRDEMQAFITDEENSRDYKSKVALRVKSIFELEKMEIAMSIGHKSNWSNDALKSARSSRLYCRLIELSRMIPLYKPGGGSTALGDEGKPNYMVVVSEEEAASKRSEDKQKLLKKRHDFEIINTATLDEETKTAKEAELKAAETAAYKGISSIPTTIVGRVGERPEGKAAKQDTPLHGPATVIQLGNSTSSENANRQRSRSRPLMDNGSTNSERPLYDSSYDYQAYRATAAPGQNQSQNRSQSENRNRDGNYQSLPSTPPDVPQQVYTARRPDGRNGLNDGQRGGGGGGGPF